jgi:hypothetical protein
MLRLMRRAGGLGEDCNLIFELGVESSAAKKELVLVVSRRNFALCVINDPPVYMKNKSCLLGEKSCLRENQYC